MPRRAARPPGQDRERRSVPSLSYGIRMKRFLILHYYSVFIGGAIMLRPDLLLQFAAGILYKEWADFPL